MPSREYYTVDRSPQEMRDLWDWAVLECHGKLEHENPYAMGVLACMEYLMGETQQRPQDYKGLFTLKNVMRQSVEKVREAGGVGNAGLNELADNSLDTLLPGNPKTLFYNAPLLLGDAPGGEGLVNDGNHAVGSNADDRGSQG